MKFQLENNFIHLKKMNVHIPLGGQISTKNHSSLNDNNNDSGDDDQMTTTTMTMTTGLVVVAMIMMMMMTTTTFTIAGRISPRGVF